MIPIAQTRLIQIPTPRLAKKNVSGMEISRTRTSTVATDPMRDRDEALRERGRQLDAELAEGDQQHGQQPEEQHDLSDRPRVPADDGDRRALALARVPAGQRRQREEESEEEGQAAAPAGQPPALAGSRPRRSVPGRDP